MNADEILRHAGKGQRASLSAFAHWLQLSDEQHLRGHRTRTDVCAGRAHCPKESN